MNLWQAISLGVVQGITEFFPISSSGHFVIMQGLFGLKEPQLAFDIFLHLGTLGSIFIFFWKDILGLARNRRLLFLIAAASVPTFIIGFFLKDAATALFGMPRFVGAMILLTGLALIGASFYSGRIRKTGAGLLNSLIVGIAQGIAVIPGISRSGSTIAAGLLSGFEKEEVVRFSFLLSVPAILGASLLEIMDIGKGITGEGAGYFFAGAFAACMTGIIAIKVVINVVRNNALHFFGIYCVLAGGIILILL